ncbi:glycosyltransferase family 2 protein [Ornithinibacillus californiensis]|uniref:glycosyltransferase family 2 protein n=1 Tax=Ornithinibacillus californiensis TaxID=161536 RepID=UPI00064D73D8|nr:glycosyltransferase family 2 protein [Ornithinibacillus californiensis]
MNNIKVSIVVPIYKVEKYIHRCMESILNQTYTNLEIILVDDGSPDNCGAIADEYGKKDYRVRVFHKENGGLSDARNYGMQYVTGEYTMFVDSDDWLQPNMIEEMMKYSLKYQADIVQSAFYYAYEDRLYFDSRYYDEVAEPIVMDRDKVMYELVVNERVKNFAWGKLYRTELIRDIPFKKGVLFEDVFWAHQVMHLVNKFVLIPQPFYFYLQREDSIVATYSPRNLDFIKGLRERHRFIEMHYQDLVEESYKTILKMSLIHYNLLLQNRQKDKDGKHRKEIKDYIHAYHRELREASGDDHELHKQLTLFMFHPMVNVLYLAAKKGLRIIHFLPRHTGVEQVKL